MMSRKQLQQAFALVSFVSFFGSTIYGGIGAINAANQQLAAGTPKVAPSVESQVQAQVKGYEMVLQREPENQVALEGLVTARLQLQDRKGAIAPLGRLVKLHPERQDYKMLLAQVKQQVGKGDRRG